MRMPKGCNGYIRSRKMREIVIITAILAVSVGLFLLGYFATGTKRNLLTVFAVLGVLPAAKAVVALVLFVPYRSFSEEAFAQVKEICGEGGHLYSDLVFTSQKSVMHLDALYVSGTEAAALDLSGKNAKKATEYFTEYMKKCGHPVHIHVFTGQREFCDRVRAMSDNAEEESPELAEFIRMILV